MARKKNYYYVLVFTSHGPVYVTSVDNASKYAHWEETEKPLEMGKNIAEDLALGLSLNSHNAVVVCTLYEVDYQPYNYADYRCEFIKKED